MLDSIEDETREKEKNERAMTITVKETKQDFIQQITKEVQEGILNFMLTLPKSAEETISKVTKRHLEDMDWTECSPQSPFLLI